MHFAFIGDSTFFHTGIPGVVNAVYNGADDVLVVLDNSTTAMTGHQPHPGTGRDHDGRAGRAKVSIPKVLEGLGVATCGRREPLRFAGGRGGCRAGRGAARRRARGGASSRPASRWRSRRKARSRWIARPVLGCRRCVRELGCPAHVYARGQRRTSSASLCYGLHAVRSRFAPLNAMKGGAGSE